MSLHGEYDDQNIFAKILRHDIPAAIVHEDDDTMTFMDAYPQSRGHVLVVPKTPARNLLEIDEDALQKLILQVKHISQAVELALKPDGIFVAQFNGAPAGQSVYHIHFHVIPRYEGEEMKRHGDAAADKDDLDKLAKDIADRLAEIG